MKAKEERMISAAGGESGYWNHAAPEKDCDKLIPSSLVVNKITIKDAPDFYSSADVIALIQEKGGMIEDMPFHYYSPTATIGKSRKLDNSDMLTGKEPVFGDMQRFIQVDKKARTLVQSMLSHIQPMKEKNKLALMECEDLEKVCYQQWRPIGSVIESPLAKLDKVQLQPPQMKALRVVTDVYYRNLKRSKPELISADPRALRLLDDDPPDTMTGLPTCQSGERTISARLSILKLIPEPLTPGVPWMDALDSVGANLGLPEGYMTSLMQAYRTGPISPEKAVKLMTFDGWGFSATKEAYGAYCRARKMYPAPFQLNYAWSPLYVQLSSARQATLGAWHTPQDRENQINALRKFKYIYSSDFHGMDTSITVDDVVATIMAVRDAGFQKETAQLVIDMYPRMGILYPHFFGQYGLSSMVTGAGRPWGSGVKLTSELDTIIGIAVHLDCLNQQIPDFLDGWVKGKYIVCCLGDDVIFGVNHLINMDKFHEDALSRWGKDIDLVEDAIFLKWFMPVIPEVPKLTRPLSRLIQQTIANEDRYSGTEGGDKPSAILRLGLSSRMIAIKDHPWIQEYWPSIFNVISELKYFDDADPIWIESIKKAQVPEVTAKDAITIQEYAARVPSYFLKLLDQAKYQPSAAMTIKMIEAQTSISNVVAPPGPAIRKAYAEALAHNPTGKDYDAVLDMVSANVYGQNF